jgi:hypothetical protein
MWLDFGQPSSYSGSGATVTDISPTPTANVTLTGSPTFSSIDGGGSEAFNGTTQYGTGAGTPLGLSAYTKSFWFKLTSYTGGNNVVSSSAGGHFSYFSGGNKLQNGHTFWSNFAAFTSVATFNLNTWYHVCVTFNTATGMALYINGVLDSTYVSTTTNPTNTPVTGTGQVDIANYGAGNFLTGSIGQVMVYNRALTDTEIARNYAATKSRYTYKEDIIRDNLILNIDPASALSYPGSGTVVADISGYNYHPTLINGPTLAGSGATSSFLLDGTNDYLQISSAYTHTFNAGVTVDVWVKFNASGDYGRLLDISDGAGTNTVYLVAARYATSNNMILAARSSTGQNLTSGIRTTTTPISNGTIQNFTFVIGPGNTDTIPADGSKIYCNSVLQTTVLDGDTLAYVPYVVNKTAWIGRSNFASNAYLSANIYAYKIYNRALSAAEIKQNFQSLRGRYGV